MRTQQSSSTCFTPRRVPTRAGVALFAGLGVLLGGCQQEMSREDKGYSLPSFKGVSDSGMRASSSNSSSSSPSRSDSSQNKPSSSGSKGSGSDQNKPASRGSRGMV